MNRQAAKGYIAFIFALALLGGCASSPPSLDDEQDTASSATDESDAQDAALETATVETPAEEVPEREFPIETLYSLLVAEIASGRERYEVVLNNYAQEARRTKDLGVVAHATRVARYLNAHAVSLEMSQLWVELEPDNTEALFSASSELAQTGQLLEALKMSEQLQRLGSTPIFESIAARAARATDTQREQLIIEFDRLLNQYPDDVQLLVSKAVLLQSDNQPEAALTFIERALQIREDDVQAAIMEARLLYQLERPEEALTRLERMLNENPDNNLLRLQYARFLAGIDLEQAQRQFEILVKQRPNDGDLLQALGLVAFQRNDLDTAKSVFNHMLAIDANANTAHFYLGKIAEGDENIDGALEHYLAVKAGQDFLPSLSQAINLLGKMGENQRIHLILDNWRDTYPDQAPRFYLLEAQTLARYQQNDRALEVLTGALEKHSNHPDLLYSRAMVYEQVNQLAMAETDLRTIIKYQPNNATVLNALGYTLADRTNRYEEALELIEKAHSIQPNEPAIIDSLGWVQYRLKNYDQALIHLRQAFKLFKDHEVAAHLGEVLWVTGETEEARAIWTEGMRLNPESDIIPETVKRLTGEE